MLPFLCFFYVYIIGLMNTADRSLAMIDYALKRRFAFYEMKPAFDSDGFNQIFSYVKNKAAQSVNEVSGLLLYAKTDEETFPDSCYTIIGNKISVKTLDLNQDFRSIQEQLNTVLQEWNPSLEFVSE